MRSIHVPRWLAIVALGFFTGVAACTPTAAPSAPTASAPTPSSPTKLTAAYSEIVFANLPLWVAKEAGIFAQNGLDVELQQVNSTNAVSALLSGEVQVDHGGGSEVLSAFVGGADLEILAVLDGVYPYLMMAQPSIQTPDELRGKKIGISQPGSSSDIATRVALRKLGLVPDQDVTIVPVGSLANRTAALLSGAIDAGLDNPPGSVAQQRLGLHVLLDLAALKLPTANNTVAMQRSFVDANHDTVQKYVDSLVEAQARIKQDRDFSIQVLKQYYQSNDDEGMAAAYAFELEVMPNTLLPSTDQFTDIIDTLAAQDPRVRQADLSKLLVTSFVQSAAARHVGQS